MSFDNLGLSPRLLEAVAAMGYTRPTPIQRDAIPYVVEGRDVVGCAQTGTGKTAAFVLPLMQRIASKPGGPRALVVTPTRELAGQIEGVALEVAKLTKHRVAVVYGGVGYEPQIKALKRGVDVLVATPGRLLDLIERKVCNLSNVEILVLDEADRMLDMGFWPQVRKIIAGVPASRQNLLFSATMSADVQRIVSSTLHDPVRVEVAPANTPIELIEQRVYPVGGQQKSQLLVHLINENNLDRVIVFTRTKHRADRVAKVLHQNGIKCAAIHGDRSQSQRQAALDGLKAGRVRVLVATDVVARGIDIDDVSHVVNYDLPNTPEDYVHRIGRTARAGKTGTAVSLLSPEEHEALRDIEVKIGAILQTHDAVGFDYSQQRLVPNPERAATRAVRTVFSSSRGRGRRRR
ncbi:MAG: DEAD/DEAH box helicase [Coriobacteriia bacterium]|nr:DEAD/DEAH box helicase [Actinomycetota bacterium]MDZ4166625.1 DEAD/DEAH box helicase [Coriobacteriia bacterium]